MRKVLIAAGVAIVLGFAASIRFPKNQYSQGDALAGPATQTCDVEPPDGYKQAIRGLVSGDEVVITISSRFGGAVESLTWRSKEFVNIFDHGRQISYAWHMDDYGGCWNPTEPGSAKDLYSDTSTSELLSVCKNGESSMTSTTLPAYWLQPGEPSGRDGYCSGGVLEAVNETLVADHILEKTMQIGYAGIDNVILFDASITLPVDYEVNQLEIPTGYLTSDFDDYWVYNPQTGELLKPESETLQEPWSFVHNTSLPPILSTPDGEYAMGAYTAESILSYSILLYDVPDPTDRTNKWNIVMREEPAPAGVYNYQSFAIVGTLEEVQEAMRELYKLHPTDFEPPVGSVDAASCQQFAGWAWDPKAPNQPIDVEIYDVSEAGVKTLLTTVTADMLREDLPPVLGDNGEHGFVIAPGDVLPDGERHTLLFEAVNSVEGLDNQALFPAEHVLECPQLAPEPTTETEVEAVETEAVVDEEEPLSTPEDRAGGVLPCLGGLLPLVFGVFGLWGLRRREW